MRNACGNPGGEAPAGAAVIINNVIYREVYHEQT